MTDNWHAEGPLQRSPSGDSWTGELKDRWGWIQHLTGTIEVRDGKNVLWIRSKLGDTPEALRLPNEKPDRSGFTDDDVLMGG